MKKILKFIQLIITLPITIPLFLLSKLFGGYNTTAGSLIGWLALVISGIEFNVQ